MKKIYLLLAVSLFSLHTNAQTIKNKKEGNYNFTSVKDLEASSVSNQNQSSTCWSFSSLSFLESELLRMGKGTYKLSPMYVVRKAYEGKAEKYVRMHGTQSFAAGGAFHDMLWVLRNYGLVPLEVYSGNTNAENLPVHWEMDEGLKAYMDAVIKAKNGGKLSTYWPLAVSGILDAYLGKEPTEFNYVNKKYTPKTFASSLGLDADNYIAITSFSHHPFYNQFLMEVPDNWAGGQCYNVPLNELKSIISNAVNTGYSVAWAADVSEKGFSFKNGVAIVPENPWKSMSEKQIEEAFNEPVKQLEITQENRQLAFDNYETQDDHGMHITGIFKAQNGDVYYKVKNSWGTERNECGGYLYASEAYVLYKTTNILVHKDAIPSNIKKKLGL